MRLLRLPAAILLCLSAVACVRTNVYTDAPPATTTAPATTNTYARQHLDDYAVVPLTADLSAFDDKGKRMLARLVEAAQVTDDLYWLQSWPDRSGLLASAPDAATRELLALNFGPWDRLNNDTPIVAGIGPRPPGSAFYPEDMTKAAFDAAKLPDKTSWYTLLRRDPSGQLITFPTTSPTGRNSSVRPRCCARLPR